MNLWHLKYFQDAAAAGSVARSAAANRVSPSAVSQAIRTLEVELGVPLVEHARRRFELTEAGRRLVDLAPRVLDAVHAVRDEVRDPQAPPAGPLVLGISHSIATSLAGELLARFSARYPLVTLRLKTGTTESLKELVRSGAADLGVFADDGDLAGLDAKVVRAGRFVLVEAKRGRARSERPFLVTEPRTEVREFLAAYRRRFGREAGVFMQIESWEIVAHLAASGLGIGYLPDYLLDGPHGPRLAVRDLKLPAAHYELCVVHARGRPPARNARLLVEMLVESGLRG